MTSAAHHTLKTLAAAALLAVQPLAMALVLPANGYVTTNEVKLDAIFSQRSFGDTPVDIRFNASTSIVNVALSTIDTAAEWAALLALGSNAASPTVNMYFVDKILWCGGVTGTTIGCASQPGNVIALDSSWAANATYGANLAAHELGHNLGLAHLLPDDGTNLMNPTISESFALSSGAGSQVATILASGLVQTDLAGKFIKVTPIAVLVAAPIPEPSQWALLLLGGTALLAAARRQRRRGDLG